MKFKIISLAILILAELSSVGQTGFTRSNEYNRLRLSTSDLKKICNSILYYYLEVPIDSSLLSDKAHLYITCQNKGKEIILTSFDQISELNIDGEDYSAFNLDYTYRAKPIAVVNIALSNYSRTLSVTGKDIKKVEALYRDIDDQLRSNENSLGWINWGMVFLFLSFIIFSVALTFGMIAAQVLFSKKRDKESVVSFIVCLLICLLLIIFSLSPISFSDIFPGFLLTNEKVPWYVKNALLIVVIGILGSFGTIYQIIIFLIGKSKKDFKTTGK
ncbi:MAG: hypothetical protein NTY07_11165 [Bacteroidia bacterium]|nr:hypothetical protein [Bacteroidia bacterium]